MERSHTAAAARPASQIRALATSHPVGSFSVVVVGVIVPLQMTLLVGGWSVLPGKAAELVVLLGVAALISAWIGGRPGVRGLFAGLTRWRIGPARWLLVLGAMPLLTLGVGAASGTLRSPASGWARLALLYAVTLFLIGVTASLWEETAWAGFVQRRMIARKGLLVGSLLTTIPFGLIHLPLAFEGDGWAGTTWREAFVDWAFLLGALPFFRYLAGVLLLDTGGSVLSVAVLHASFNASGAMSAVPAGWQYVPAVAVIAALVVLWRRVRGQPVVGRPVPAPSADTGHGTWGSGPQPSAAATAKN